jgi:glucosamine--fructose-6-phosphate aminotransferase (isomerizing)
VPETAIVTRAGAENSVACKTYLSILAALDWLGSMLCGDDLGATLAELAQAPELAEGYLTRWQDHVEELRSELAGIEHVFLVGRGSSLATVGNGGLILKESAHVHAEGMSAPAFRHGPIEMLRDDVFVVVFAGGPATAPLNVRLFDDIQNAGGRTALISESAAGAFRLPAGPARLRPILEMLPVQMMSLALAQLKEHEPGVFRHTSKVTTVE